MLDYEKILKDAMDYDAKKKKIFKESK